MAFFLVLLVRVTRDALVVDQTQMRGWQKRETCFPIGASRAPRSYTAAFVVSYLKTTRIAAIEDSMAKIVDGTKYHSVCSVAQIIPAVGREREWTPRSCACHRCETAECFVRAGILAGEAYMTIHVWLSCAMGTL